MFLYGWVPLLSSWNYHHIVYRLYSKINKKLKKKTYLLILSRVGVVLSFFLRTIIWFCFHGLGKEEVERNQKRKRKKKKTEDMKKLPLRPFKNVSLNWHMIFISPWHHLAICLGVSMVDFILLHNVLKLCSWKHTNGMNMGSGVQKIWLSVLALPQVSNVI